MKAMLSCVVLAVLVALIAADDDCNFPFKSGQKCNETFCNLVKTTTKECKTTIEKENPEIFKAFQHNSELGKEVGSEGEGSEGKCKPHFGPEQIKAFKDACEAMRKCVEPQVQNEQQYKDVATLCDKTTTEETPDDLTRPIYNLCLTLNLVGCCKIKPHSGSDQQSGDSKAILPGTEEAGFMATENHLVSMFFN